MTIPQPLQKTDGYNSFVQSMLDASMHGIVLLQPVREIETINDFSIQFANAAIKSQLGFEPDLSGEPRISEVFPEYKKFGFFDACVTALKTRQVQRKELFYKDHRVEGWFDLGIAPHEDSLVVTFVNITQSKNVLYKLEYTAAQLHTILDISQSGMFLFSPVLDDKGTVTDFRFVLANRALAAYIGQEPGTLTGELGSKWFPAYKTNGLFELYKETFETGKSDRFDFHYNDGAIDAWLDIMTTKVGNEVLVTFTDFTAVKRLQLQLEESVNELKRSNSYLEDFAYAASHDLQEPLRKIHFFSDRLKARFNTQLGDEGSMMLQRMEGAANRMRVLIDDLLAYSRVSGRRNTFEELNLEMLIKEVLNDLEASIKEKQAVITVSELPRLTGDKLQLRQLFQNLLSNALKYHKPDVPPHILIRSRLVRGKDVQKIVSLSDLNREFYLIEIIDNGLGFEPENAKKIFQMFFRLHGRSEYPGTGIGLAIVQKVAENHKGFVAAESEPDKGSTFRVLLPC